MSATDNGRIDEIISALQFLGKEKLISYSEEIKWLTDLKQRLANSEWKNVNYEPYPPKRNKWDKESDEVLVGSFYENGHFKVITGTYHYNIHEWGVKGILLHPITHWMPLPEEPKNK